MKETLFPTPDSPIRITSDSPGSILYSWCPTAVLLDFATSFSFVSPCEAVASRSYKSVSTMLGNWRSAMHDGVSTWDDVHESTPKSTTFLSAAQKRSLNRCRYPGELYATRTDCPRSENRGSASSRLLRVSHARLRASLRPDDNIKSSDTTWRSPVCIEKTTTPASVRTYVEGTMNGYGYPNSSRPSASTYSRSAGENSSSTWYGDDGQRRHANPVAQYQHQYQHGQDGAQQPQLPSQYPASTSYPQSGSSQLESPFHPQGEWMSVPSTSPLPAAHYGAMSYNRNGDGQPGAHSYSEASSMSHPTYPDAAPSGHAYQDGEFCCIPLIRSTPRSNRPRAREARRATSSGGRSASRGRLSSANLSARRPDNA